MIQSVSAAVSQGISVMPVQNHLPATQASPLIQPGAAPKASESLSKMSTASANYPIAWNLSRNIKNWKKLGADSFICSAVQDGYKIPFYSTPISVSLPNNKSALKNDYFVVSEIEKLLSSGCIKACDSPPKVVNPLSVDCKANGKMRLILDLRHVNKDLFKFSVKYEGLEMLAQFVESKGFCIKFDLKSGYHHLGIFPPHQEYLGFSWRFGNSIKYYKFCVLSFGLSSACSIFTKLLRPLVKKWRGEGLKVILYLDDGICTNVCPDSLAIQANKMQKDLHALGFVVNEEKSSWNPSNHIVWLGFHLDLTAFEISVPDNNIDLLATKLEKTSESEFSTARKLSSLVGTLISFEFALGPIVQFMSRGLQL